MLLKNKLIAEKQKKAITSILQSAGHKSLPRTLPQAPNFVVALPAKRPIIHNETRYFFVLSLLLSVSCPVVTS
jgi:hypothetical protein